MLPNLVPFVDEGAGVGVDEIFHEGRQKTRFAKIRPGRRLERRESGQRKAKRSRPEINAHVLVKRKAQGWVQDRNRRTIEEVRNAYADETLEL